MKRLKWPIRGGCRPGSDSFTAQTVLRPSQFYAPDSFTPQTVLRPRQFYAPDITAQTVLRPRQFYASGSLRPCCS